MTQPYQPHGDSRRPFSLVILAAVIACGGSPPAADARSVLPAGEVRIDAKSPKRTSIVTEPVVMATEHAIARLPAQVVPDEDHTVRVFSPVSGRIVALVARPGDRVRAGQTLAELRSSDAAQTTSDAQKAATVWSTARAALVRATDLYEHKVIASRELEQARNDEAQARAEMARAQARARQLGLPASAVSDTYLLRAPVSGVVVDRSANPGAEVRPDNAQSLFTISSLDTVWLSVVVSQRDLALVHRGARLRFHTEAHPDQRFEARVSYMSDALDPVSRTAVARATVPNPGNLLQVNVTGDAELLVTEATPMATVPSRALVTHGTGTVVFVEVSPGRFVRRAVTVRDDDGTTASVSSGLAAGERVVTTGSLLLASEADRAAR